MAPKMAMDAFLQCCASALCYMYTSGRLFQEMAAVGSPMITRVLAN